MTQGTLDADEARHELYDVMKQDGTFEEKAERALELGESYLQVENGHVTKIHTSSDYWTAIASTDPDDGTFAPGLVLDLATTYCRRTIQQDDPVALDDAPAQGWDDDPAFVEHELNCYHGTTITIDDETYGTVCFVSEEPRDRPFTDEETLFAELIGRMLEHEIQRQRSEKRLERLEEFASVISHDLRNPLAVAKSRLDLEQRDSDSANLKQIATSLDRMDTLIDDVLAAASQGDEIEEVEQVSLAIIADRCWETVATADGTLVVENDIHFEANPGRLRQLFENLLRNAVEHGGPTVAVRVGTLSDDTGFYVADDGPGIDATDRTHVFESGFSTDPGGIGLGLSIVEGIVAAHGWSVDVVESERGGARFEVADVDILPDRRT